MSLTVVIVDDEPLARERIRTLLACEPDVEVTAECRNGPEAVAAVRSTRPNLMFLDIQMPEMDGFEVLAELESSQWPLVVFVTAYDQYALNAFEVHALDYLVKPFDPPRFRSALARAREQIAGRATHEVSQRMLGLLEELESRRRCITRFVVSSEGRIFFVKTRDVDSIEASGNYMKLYSGRDTHLIRETMADLEEKLDPTQFVRIHRSWIVNIDRIRELHAWFYGGYIVMLQSGQRIQVGRKYRDNVDRILGEAPERTAGRSRNPGV